jgi:hypothetical protein
MRRFDILYRSLRNMEKQLFLNGIFHESSLKWGETLIEGGVDSTKRNGKLRRADHAEGRIMDEERRMTVSPVLHARRRQVKAAAGYSSR